MPGNPHITANYNQLRAFQQAGLKDYITGESDTTYNINELLEAVLPNEYTEEEIVRILRSLKKESPNEETLLEKADAIFEFKPGLMGLRVDIKKLVKKLFGKSS